MPHKQYALRCCRYLIGNAAHTICTQMLQVTYWQCCTHNIHSDSAGNVLPMPHKQYGLRCCRYLIGNAAHTICTQILQVTYWQCCTHNLHSDSVCNLLRMRYWDFASNPLRVLRSKSALRCYRYICYIDGNGFYFSRAINVNQEMASNLEKTYCLTNIILSKQFVNRFFNFIFFLVLRAPY